jgi:PPK2 family polyphosphate:nucleotide phosphotransferase
MKRIDGSPYLVKPGSKVDLARLPTKVKPVYKTKHDYKTTLRAHVGQLSDLQSKLYAGNQHAVLIVFQAMDAAGKDSAIKHIMTGVNPQGCTVVSFKHPSAEELDHDFLWRTTRWLPERGHIGIFNRSYYEEVLIVRVHPSLLRAQRLPPEALAKPHFWRERYRSITELERHLSVNGTRIVKFFLHLSRDEQRRRLLERIDDPHKNWKFSADDLHERRAWNRYMKAYEECLEATSTAEAPWYAIPADDKANARLLVSGVILETLRGLNLRYPTVGGNQRRELERMRAKLAKD